LAIWLSAAVAGQVAVWRTRASGDPRRELDVRRRLQPWLVLEHAAFLLALAAGFALMGEKGFRLGYPRWLSLKLGLVVFLALPLEVMHAYVGHVWIARGLRQTRSPPYSKDLARGLGIDEMIRTLALLLLGVAIPLMVWLSLAKPF
jgi:hypothetical protein